MTRVASRWLRMEGAVVGIAALAAMWWTDIGLWMALAVLIAPDIALGGYLIGNRVGGILYNIVHSYSLPVMLLGVLVGSGAESATLGLALGWIAHCGLDRALGYGLKGSRFGETHLGPIGRDPRP